MTPFYKRDGITIYCGDCLEVMPQLEPPVDAIITDLPYGTTQNEWDSTLPFELMWKEVKRLLKSSGAFVTTASQPFTSALVMSNPSWFKWEDILDKKQPVGFLNAKIMPLRRHENILVFGDGRITYNPQMTKGKYRNKGKHSSQSDCYGQYGNLDNFNDDYYPTSILEFHNADQLNKKHPNQKPLALYLYLIRTYTNTGELILDNTMGSGTTLVAAQNEGRRAIGIEISEDYCRIAVDRLRQPSFFSLPVMQPAKPEQPALFEDK